MFVMHKNESENENDIIGVSKLDLPHNPYQFHRDFHNFFNSIHSHKISHFYEQINLITHPGAVKQFQISSLNDQNLVATSNASKNQVFIWDMYNIRKNSMKDMKNHPHESDFIIEHPKNQELGDFQWSHLSNSLLVSY